MPDTQFNPGGAALALSGKQPIWDLKLPIHNDAYIKQVLADGATDLWRFNEQSGTTALDKGPGASNGTYSGVMTLNNPGPMADQETAAKRDGSTSLGRVTVAPAASTTTFTIEFFMRVDGSSNDGFEAIIQETNSPFDGIGYFFTGGNAGKLTYEISGVDHLSAVIASPSVYNHIVLSVNAGVGQFYVNGATSGSTFSGVVSKSFTRIFGGTSINEEFNGAMANFAIYIGTALTAAQVLNHFNLSQLPNAGPVLGLTGQTPIQDLKINIQDGGSYATKVLSDTPLGYWKMIESSGSLFADSSGNGSDLTISGPVTLYQLAMSNFSRSAQFNPTTATAGRGAGYDPTGGKTAFTFEAWFNHLGITYNSQFDAIVFTSGNTNGIWAHNGLIEAGFHISGSQRTVATGIAMPNSGWHHIAVTWTSGDLIRVYLDGLQISSSGPFSGSIDAQGFLGVGSFAGPQFPFQGLISNVAIYGTALSASQLMTHFQFGQGPLLGVAGQNPIQNLGLPVHGIYLNTILRYSPSLLWRMDQGSGNFIDLIASLAAVPNGAIVYGRPGATQDGDTAAGFNGTTVSCAVADNAAWHFGDVFTLSCWIKRSSIRGGTDDSFDEGLIRVNGSGTPSMQIRFDNTIRITINSIASIGTSSATIIDTISWHHVAWTKNGATNKIYLDGVDVSGTLTNATAASGSTGVTLGALGPGNNFFTGDLDEVAIWSRALPIDQIQDIYKVGSFNGPSSVYSALTPGTAPTMNLGFTVGSGSLNLTGAKPILQAVSFVRLIVVDAEQFTFSVPAETGLEVS